VDVEQAATHPTQHQLAMEDLEAELDGIQAEVAEELPKLVLIAQTRITLAQMAEQEVLELLGKDLLED
jgi:hypothetical protein